MLHVLTITMHAPNGCYSKASSLNHLLLALPQDRQRRFVLRRRKPKFYLQHLRKEDGLYKGQFDMRSDTMRSVCAQWFTILFKVSKIKACPN